MMFTDWHSRVIGGGVEGELWRMESVMGVGREEQ